MRRTRDACAATGTTGSCGVRLPSSQAPASAMPRGLRRIVIVFAFAAGLWLFALAADRMHADAAPAAQPPTSSTGAHYPSEPPRAARVLRAQVAPIVGRVAGRAVPVRHEQKPTAVSGAVRPVAGPVVATVRTVLRDGGHTIETTVAPVRRLVGGTVGRPAATPVAVPILRPSQPNALGPAPLPASTIRRAASAALRAKAPSTAVASAAVRGPETAATARAVSGAGGSDPSRAGAPAGALRATSGERPTRNPEPPVRPDQPPAVSPGSTTSATARPPGADAPGAVITSAFGLSPAAHRAYLVSWTRSAGSGPARLPGFSPD